jgi:uncharacterized protein (DUF983 family)
MAASQDPRTSVLRASLLGRCPRCGQGALFKGGMTLDIHDGCPSCGLDYRFIDSGDGPAVFVIMILGFVMLGAALTLEFTLHPPIWVHGLLWVPATLLLAFGLLRPLKAGLIALQFRNKAAEGRLAGNGE